MMATPINAPPGHTPGRQPTRWKKKKKEFLARAADFLRNHHEMTAPRKNSTPITLLKKSTLGRMPDADGQYFFLPGKIAS